MDRPHPKLIAAQAALRSGDYTTCHQAAASVLHTKPGNPDANYFAGYALLRLGRRAEAMPLLQRAYHGAPTNTHILAALGEAGFYAHDFTGAADWFAKVIAIDPRSLKGWLGLASSYHLQGNLEKAIETGSRALEIDPDNTEAAEIVSSAYSLGGRPEESLRVVLPMMARQPGNGILQQLAIFPYLYAESDPRPLTTILKNLGEQLARVCPPMWKGFDNDRDPNRKLRVGYVAREFYYRWGPRFIGPLLKYRNPEQFDLFCYYQTTIPSEKTADRSPNATWRDTTGMHDPDVARLIRDDRIDILVDLVGWIIGLRLPAFSYAPAPVQCTYLGFPATTGLPAIGYRFVDAITDPPGYEPFASEELVRLPGCFVCPQPNLAPPVTPPPCTTGAPFTFGSFNTMNKIGAPVLELWAKIIRAVPGSRLLIKNRTLGQKPTEARVRAALESLGVPPASIDLRGETDSEEHHLASYGEVDIALDPFPYNGTTTTFDALWMGVPVVTAPGQSHVARVTASMLINSGNADLVAKTEGDLVALCVKLASNPAALAQRRQSQRELVRTSRLCDGPAFVKDLESTYRDLWTRWCKSVP